MSCLFLLPSFLLLCLSAQSALAHFSPDFVAFMKERLPKLHPDLDADYVDRVLLRPDLQRKSYSYHPGGTQYPFGDMTSFGGAKDKEDREQKVKEGKGKVPVILVHGTYQNAEKMNVIREELLKKGYTDFDIYAISVGPQWDEKSNGLVTPKDGELSHEYVEAIRILIEMVSEYTGQPKVDIAAYSAGVLLTRKAIKGGSYVDEPNMSDRTRVPLTKKVRTFVDVAGPNHGCFLCDAIISKLGLTDDSWLLNFKLCNKKNGLVTGSEFIKDLTVGEHEYLEGINVFSLATDWDMVIGTWLSKLKGFGKSNVILDNKAGGHEDMLPKSARLISMILSSPETAKELFSDPDALYGSQEHPDKHKHISKASARMAKEAEEVHAHFESKYLEIPSHSSAEAAPEGKEEGILETTIRELSEEKQKIVAVPASIFLPATHFFKHNAGGAANTANALHHKFHMAHKQFGVGGAAGFPPRIPAMNNHGNKGIFQMKSLAGAGGPVGSPPRGNHLPLQGSLSPPRAFSTQSSQTLLSKISPVLQKANTLLKMVPK